MYNLLANQMPKTKDLIKSFNIERLAYIGIQRSLVWEGILWDLTQKIGENDAITIAQL